MCQEVLKWEYLCLFKCGFLMVLCVVRASKAGIFVSS